MIPIGNGSLWNNKELKYCLRSIEMFYPNCPSITIVGVLPSFINKSTVQFIPKEDSEYIVHRSRNIYEKIIASNIYGDFIFFNDDHFLLRPLTALPYYYGGRLADVKNTTLYSNTIINSIMCGATYNYDIHVPIIYNYQLFKERLSVLDWNKNYGYCIKSIYCKEMYSRGVYMPDLKLNEQYSYGKLFELTHSRNFFSIGDRAINEDLEIFLQYLYPQKSKYEL
jgi:hypothetical protein